MASSQLPNYLRTHRKRLGLSQDEVAYLLGAEMRTAEVGVDVLAHLIARDNDKIRQDIEIMIGRIIAHANAGRPAYGTPARLEFDEKIAAELSDAETMKASLKSISAAVIQIPIAHQEIEDCLHKKSSKAEGLKLLAQEAERANQFNNKLK